MDEGLELYDPKLLVLRVCGLLERLEDLSRSYSTRYLEAAAASGGYGERLRRIAEKLEAVALLASRLQSRLCAGSPGLSDFNYALAMLERSYAGIVAGEPPVPAAVRALFYEVYVSVKKLV